MLLQLDMRFFLYKTFSSARGFWLSLMILVLSGAFVSSFVLRVHQSQARVTEYFSVWEEDLGRSLLIEKNTDLLLKISHQLQDLDDTVLTSFASLDAKVIGKKPAHCSFETTVPISLSTLPAGHVGVCFSPQKLLEAAAVSPLFLFCLLIILPVGLLSTQRESKKELALHHARQISDLSRQVAHDIRGPLMALKALASTPQKDSADRDSLLEGAIERIHSIAEDLLKKSKSNPPNKLSATAKNSLSFCFLQNAAEEILSEFRVREQTVAIHFMAYEKVPLMLGLSKVQTQRIISNLVQNALDSLTNRPDPSVSVMVHRKSGFAILEIIDNGCGIASEKIESALAGKSHGKINGNGLGLSSSRKIIENIGGHLELHSKVDLGTRVVLKIPLAAEESKDSLFDYKS